MQNLSDDQSNSKKSIFKWLLTKRTTKCYAKYSGTFTFHVLKQFHTFDRLTVSMLQLRCSRKERKWNTLVYMWHVTFMLIVESENKNSMRALYLDVCSKRENLLIIDAHVFGETKIGNFKSMLYKIIWNGKLVAMNFLHGSRNILVISFIYSTQSKKTEVIRLTIDNFFTWLFVPALQNEMYVAFSTNRNHHIKFNCYNPWNEGIHTTNMKRFRTGSIEDEFNRLTRHQWIDILSIH